MERNKICFSLVVDSFFKKIIKWEVINNEATKTFYLYSDNVIYRYLSSVGNKFWKSFNLMRIKHLEDAVSDKELIEANINENGGNQEWDR